MYKLTLVWRLPRRLRPAHNSQRDKSGGEKKVVVRRPSRRHRRRPSNLLQEYNRRQREGRARWLETHIWHAKRFHMVERWGHKIPDHPNDKGWRACYRAAASKCIMWDFSYLRLVQLEGRPELLMEKINMVTRGGAGGSLSLGPGEEEVVVYEGRGGGRCVGRVTYLWRPGQGEERLLWLWVHPAIYHQILQLLTALFDLQGQEEEEQQDEGPDLKKPRLEEPKPPKSVHLTKLAPRLLPPTVLKSTCGQVLITLLENSLNRFRLVGPLSSAVLSHAIQVSDLDQEAGEGRWWAQEVRRQEQGVASSVWQEWGERLPAQEKVARSPVLGLVARDPRVILPPRRHSEQLIPGGKLGVEQEASWDLQRSVLWEEELRGRVSREKEEDRVINELRGAALVPGTPLGLGEREGRLPVLLVAKGRPWGAGYDVVAPLGWGAVLWQCLVYWGARVGGLREWGAHQLEKGVLGGGEEDSEWGQQEGRRTAEERKKKHFLLPPDKRVNFAVTGAGHSAWGRDWGRLLSEWGEEVGDGGWHVVREVEVLQKLKLGQEVGCEEGGLVPVLLCVEGKGRLGEGSMLCLPLPEEQGDEEVMEPQHRDVQEGERRGTREEHRQAKKRLKRQWKKLKQKSVQVRVVWQIWCFLTKKKIQSSQLTRQKSSLNVLPTLCLFGDFDDK